MQHSGKYFKVNLTNNTTESHKQQDYILVSYDESIMLKRLASYPYIQLVVVGLFGLIGIWALLSAKEQNKIEYGSDCLRKLLTNWELPYLH